MYAILFLCLQKRVLSAIMTMMKVEGGEKMGNLDIRQIAKERKVCLWQIAERLGISEPTMTRRLRCELPEAEKEKIFAIIEKVAEEKEKEKWKN